jgi:hypothetical protein
MAVTTYIASSAGTTTAALPAGTTSGDIVVALAYSSSATTPALPAGWTNINNNAATPASRLQYRVYDGVWTMPTFTSAAVTHALTIRGQDTTSPIGVTSITNGNSTNPVFPAVTLVDTDGSSQLIRGLNHTRADSVITAPANHTSRQASGTQPSFMTCTKNSTADGASATVSISRGTTWTQCQVEVKCASAPTQQGTLAMSSASSFTAVADLTPAVQGTLAMSSASTFTATAWRTPVQAGTLAMSSTSVLSLEGTVVAGGPFTPTHLTGMLFWMDATSLALADGAPLASWPDSSGNGFDATPSAATAYYDAAGINGHPAVRFGQSGVTEMKVSPGRTVGDRTIFQVVRTIGSIGAFATTQLQNTDPYLQTYSTGGTIHTYTTPDLDSGVPWSGVGQMVTLWCNTSAHAHWLEVDGTQVTSAWTPGSSSAYFQLGANSLAPYGMNGWIGEVVIYDRTLTDPERAQVQDYLATKWASTSVPVTQDADLVMSSASSLTFGGVRAQPSALAMSAVSSLALSAVREQPALLPLTALSSLSLAGGRTAQPTLAMVATSSFTALATGIGVQSASVGFTSTSSLTFGGIRAQQPTLALTASSQLVAGAVVQKDAALALSSVSAFSTAGLRTAQPTLAMVATSSLTVAATGFGVIAGTLAMTSTSSLVLSPVRSVSPILVMSSVSSLSLAGLRAPQGILNLVSSSTLVLVAVRGRWAVLPMVTTSTLSSGGQRFAPGMSNVAGTGSLQCLDYDGLWYPVRTVG